LSRIEISDALAPLDLDAHALDAALRNAFGLSERWLAAPPVEMKSLVRDIVEQITVASDRIEIRLSRVKIAAALEAGGRSQRPDLDSIVLSIEAKLRRAGKGKRLVIENGAETEVNEGLVELIKEAFAIRNQFLSGSDNSIEAMRTPRNEQVPANFPHSTFSRANLEGGGKKTPARYAACPLRRHNFRAQLCRLSRVSSARRTPDIAGFVQAATRALSF
jgi:hypothetical protein